MLFIIGVIVLPLFLLVPPDLTEVTKRSDCIGSATYFGYSLIAICILVSILAGFMLWRVRDGYLFKQEFVIYAIAIPIGLVLYFAVSFLPFLPPYVDFVVFSILPFIVLLVSVVYPALMTFTEFYTARSETASQKEGPRRSSSDDFEAVMNNPEQLNAFIHFATELWCPENILFLQAVKRYEELFVTGSEEEEGADQGSKGADQKSKGADQGGKGAEVIREAAKEIADTFINMASLKQVNVDGAIREQVLEDIGQGHFHPGLFDQAKDHVLGLVKHDTFQKWKVAEKTVRKKKKKGPKVPSSLTTHHDSLSVYVDELGGNKEMAD